MENKRATPNLMDRQAIETDIDDGTTQALFYARRLLFNVIYFSYLFTVMTLLHLGLFIAWVLGEQGPLPRILVQGSEKLHRHITRLGRLPLAHRTASICTYITAISLLLFPLDLISVGTLILVVVTCVAITLIALKITPYSILATINRHILQMIYQIHTKGEENIPKKGGALLICNHISFIDFSMISLLTRRQLRFVMDHNIYNKPIIRALVQIGKAIPIDDYKNPAIKEAAFQKISYFLSRGDIVMIFPEGQVSYDGKMDRFKKGIVRIQKENPHIPIIPVTLTGLEGGFFSRVGRLFKPSKLPFELFRHVTATVGKPIPAGKHSLTELEQNVRQMLAETVAWHNSFLASGTTRVTDHEHPKAS